MITHPNIDQIKTVLDQNITLTDGIGCTIEHNMNSLIDNITITGADYVAADGSKPFKKLFPIDSVLKSFRPNGAGVKYAVSGDVLSSTYHNPKAYTYQVNYRTYYPGTETYYKYYLCPKGQGADITATYPQTVLTNKIIIKFEISHSTPGTWTVYKEGGVVLATGTSSDIVPFGSEVYNAGTVTLYYNGTSWSTTEPSSISAPTTITSLRLTTSGVANKYIGVVEISPRWISDLTNRLKTFTIDKETSSSVEDILPVGRVTANSLKLEMLSYEDTFTVNSYIKGQVFDQNKIYLYRNAEIKPYYKLYYSGASLTDSKGQYEKIPQGTYFLDTWTRSEFGDVNLTALDGAKFLQETVAPNVLCIDFSATAILRRLLDGIGFTNYKINLKKTNNIITDNSVFSPSYWWTDDSITVWQCIQELCRDAQMVACFDENNVLQFYTRDYLFDSTRDAAWSFRHTANGSSLPNIVSLEKSDISTANQIKVLWSTRYSNEVLPGNAQPLWQSGVDFIGAFNLHLPLSSTAGPGDFMTMFPITETLKGKQIFYHYSGYMAINSEIIEFDGVEFHYYDRTGSRKTFVAENAGSIQKILADVMPNQDASTAIQQTGRVRIKTRGAFGTTVATHPADIADSIQSWNIYDVTWEIS
jgi:hypothetical protein